MSSNLTAPTIFSFMQAEHRVQNEPTTLIHQLTSILQPLGLEQLFGQPQPLEIELGSGDGSFLVGWAGVHPNLNFIGVERLLGRVQKTDRKGRRAGLKNLRLVRIESSYLLQYLLPPHSASALHVYFPDPWPKRKHRRHRLINDAFPTLAHRVLLPGGRVFLRTDDRDYFEQMLGVFAGSAQFQPISTPAALAEHQTDFERGFRAQGIETLRAAYQAQG